MVRLIISDIDGTLVPEGCTALNPEYFKVIRDLAGLDRVVTGRRS